VRIALGRVPRLPGPGEIAHVEDVRVFPGGGGSIAFFQFEKSDAASARRTPWGCDLRTKTGRPDGTATHVDQALDVRDSAST